MTTYGHIPGVQITTSTGQVTGVVIGQDQYLTLIGVGAEDADADPEEVYEPDGRGEVEDLFGEESDIYSAYDRARTNGVDEEYVKIVKATVTESTGSVSADAPIIPDTDRISVDGDGDYDIVLDYGDELDGPNGDGDTTEIVVNPNTGEVEDNAENVELTYQHADWSATFDIVEDEFIEGEFGVIAPLTNAPTVVDEMTTVVGEMRNDIKMVVGAAPVEPTSVADDGTPELDSGKVSQDYNDDTLFMFGPTAEAGTDPSSPEYGIEMFSGAAGKMAGNDNTEPIYDDIIYGVDSLGEKVTRADNADLRAENIIPIRESANVRIEDNHSTYNQEEEGGWERDYFRRRVVDLVVATSYMITRSQIGTVLDGDTIEDVSDSLDEQFREFVNDGLLQPGGQEVNVWRADDRTIGVELTMRPYGVAKQATVDIEVVA